MSEPAATYGLQFPQLCFIGAGNMAKAIIVGLVESGYPAQNIIASNRSVEKLQELEKSLSIRTSTDNLFAAKQAEVIILAVKPLIVPDVCEQISSVITDQMFISVAAGITTQSIQQSLKAKNPVIRAMPNTPCLLSKGAIGIFTGDSLSTSQKNLVLQLFKPIGEVVIIDEEQQMDIVTALSGSGPAYYFYLSQALIEAGVELGLSEDICTQLINQTALGSAEMLNQVPLQSAKDLRQAVTSPNGTTDAATRLFDEHKMNETIRKAVVKATQRGIEMSKGK